METSQDDKHVNEFEEIEVFKDTKYWFKKDFQTIKRSFSSTIKNAPFIFIASIVFSFLMSGIGGNRTLENTLAYTLVFFPISLLGYAMFYVMIKKGYEIDPYEGAHIDTPQHANRFSINYILSSNMSKGRKIIFLFRLALYFLMIAGLLLAVFHKR